MQAAIIILLIVPYIQHIVVLVPAFAMPCQAMLCNKLRRIKWVSQGGGNSIVDDMYESYPRMQYA